ncbi:hypothetical protein OIU79_023709 [Salix purpurea]|uniref:Uncharacterized protein n=1 Tax=Salix purpurea TaxID=77065 RepID=A0A9Q0W990_SALPP|nr:hypothetical protein OIU79_023709 [Salix purpurea]
MRREDAREEAFGRDSSFWSIAEKMPAFGRDSYDFSPVSCEGFFREGWAEGETRDDGQRERRETMGAENRKGEDGCREEGRDVQRERRETRERREACRDEGIFAMEKMRGE